MTTRRATPTSFEAIADEATVPDLIYRGSMIASKRMSRTPTTILVAVQQLHRLSETMSTGRRMIWYLMRRTKTTPKTMTKSCPATKTDEATEKMKKKNGSKRRPECEGSRESAAGTAKATENEIGFATHSIDFRTQWKAYLEE